MKKIFKTIAIITACLSFSLSGYAIELNVEFSADAVQIVPGRPLLVSKMYVSKVAVRTDMTQNNRKIIDIVYPQEGKRVVMYPEQKIYMQQKGFPTLKSWSKKSVKTPCEGVKNAKCKKLLSEKINNINVEKWQVEQTINGKTFKSLHWIDSKRRIAIKELFYDGGVSELKMLGNTNLYGRAVEQWEYRYSNPAGQQRISKQWYDAELKMVIREEMPGGYLRELKNIKISKQKRSLFDIPKSYKEISMGKPMNTDKNKSTQQN